MKPYYEQDETEAERPQDEAVELAALQQFVDFLGQQQAAPERAHLQALAHGDGCVDAACGICYSLRKALVRAAGRLAPAEPPAPALENVLEAHRRFHGKVGCPGGTDCYVCEAEDALDRVRGSDAAPPREPTDALIGVRVCIDCGAKYPEWSVSSGMKCSNCRNRGVSAPPPSGTAPQ